MARVTVEDCIDKIENRFALVLLATYRTRILSAGAEPLVERDNDKNPVIALREIAGEKIIPDVLREDLIVSMQKQVDDDVDMEELQLISSNHVTDFSVQKEGKTVAEEDILATLQKM